MWTARGLTDKSYPRDNRLIAAKSPYRRGGLAPRCRLILSWRGSTFQGSDCSSVKRVRELGSERRETVEKRAIYSHYLETKCCLTFSNDVVMTCYKMKKIRIFGYKSD